MCNFNRLFDLKFIVIVFWNRFRNIEVGSCKVFGCNGVIRLVCIFYVIEGRFNVI